MWLKTVGNLSYLKTSPGLQLRAWENQMDLERTGLDSGP